jgi:pyruvate/2-oxoglutarate dehydrogenase complex dihydrolipoamide acyltransferase (E2) component
MRTLTCFIAGAVASAALAPFAIAAPGDDVAWDVVPDQTLQTMRGGVDLGASGLVAYFAIDRVVEIDGQVVARMQIVISNLNNLASGAMPTITVSGLTPTLVQILNAQQGQGLSTAAANALLSSVSSTPAAAATSAKAAPASVDPSTTPTPTSVAAAAPATDQGKIASNNIQSGSTAQFGTALTNAINAATGALGTASPVASNNSTANSGTAAAPAAATSSAPSAQTAQPIGVQPVAAQNGAASSSAAPIVLVSDLPNATAITTAVQNEVQAATIQIKTTISATLNSLSSLNSLTLASAIRNQVAAGLP